MSYTLNIDLGRYTTRPPDTEVGEIVMRLKNPAAIRRGITIERLKNAVCGGHSFTPCVMVGTTSSDWRQQQIFAFDFDNKTTPHAQPSEVERKLAKHGIPVAFAYYSFSHTDEHPRFRVITACDEIITDRDEAKTIIKGVLSLWPKAGNESQIDYSCSPLGSFFFGTSKGLISDIGNPCASFSKVDALKLHDVLTPVSAIEKPMMPNRHHCEKRDLDLRTAYAEYNLFDYVKSISTNAHLRKQGDNIKFIPCPICGSPTGFAINPTRNIYWCFSERHNFVNPGIKGGGGNIHTFIMEKYNLTENHARERFKTECLGINLEDENRQWKRRWLMEQIRKSQIGRSKD